jgi:hypothetical protein
LKWELEDWKFVVGNDNKEAICTGHLRSNRAYNYTFSLAVIQISGLKDEWECSRYNSAQVEEASSGEE